MLDTTEMMFRRKTGGKRKDKIRNEYIRGSAKVTEVSKKVQEARLRWFGYLLRRPKKEYVAKGPWKWI